MHERKDGVCSYLTRRWALAAVAMVLLGSQAMAELQQVAVGGELMALVAEENADLAAAEDRVVADEVVGVAVADRDARAPDVLDRVVLGEAEADAPAEEDADVIAHDTVVPHDGPL